MSRIVRTMPFKVEQKDLVEYFKFADRRNRRIGMNVVILTSVTFILLGVIVGLAMLVWGGALVIVVGGIWVGGSHRSIASREAVNPDKWWLTSKMTAQSEDGVLALIYEDGTLTRFPSQCIDQPVELDNTYFITRRSKLLVIIPKRAFPDQVTELEFVSTFSIGAESADGLFEITGEENP